MSDVIRAAFLSKWPARYPVGRTFLVWSGSGSASKGPGKRSSSLDLKMRRCSRRRRGDSWSTARTRARIMFTFSFRIRGRSAATRCGGWCEREFLREVLRILKCTRILRLVTDDPDYARAIEFHAAASGGLSARSLRRTRISVDANFRSSSSRIRVPFTICFFAERAQLITSR